MYPAALCPCPNPACPGRSDAALLNLDDEQIGFLRELAHWLTDQDGIMQERSKNLINIIAPLNERSVLNHRNKY